MAALRGEPVDRPAVNFYEIGGFNMDPSDPDEFNVYNSPDWRPLLQLAEERTDLIRMRRPTMRAAHENCRDEFFTTERYEKDGSRLARTTLRVGGREMTSLSRRSPDTEPGQGVETRAFNVFAPDLRQSVLQSVHRVFRHITFWP